MHAHRLKKKKKRLREHSEKAKPSQGEKPCEKKQACSQTLIWNYFGLQTREKVSACSLRRPGCGVLPRQPQQTHMGPEEACLEHSCGPPPPPCLGNSFLWDGFGLEQPF